MVSSTTTSTGSIRKSSLPRRARSLIHAKEADSISFKPISKTSTSSSSLLTIYCKVNVEVSRGNFKTVIINCNPVSFTANEMICALKQRMLISKIHANFEDYQLFCLIRSLDPQDKAPKVYVQLTGDEIITDLLKKSTRFKRKFEYRHASFLEAAEQKKIESAIDAWIHGTSSKVVNSDSKPNKPVIVGGWSQTAPQLSSELGQELTKLGYKYYDLFGQSSGGSTITHQKNMSKSMVHSSSNSSIASPASASISPSPSSTCTSTSSSISSSNASIPSTSTPSSNPSSPKLSRPVKISKSEREGKRKSFQSTLRGSRSKIQPGSSPTKNRPVSLAPDISKMARNRNSGGSSMELKPATQTRRLSNCRSNSSGSLSEASDGRRESQEWNEFCPFLLTKRLSGMPQIGGENLEPVRKTQKGRLFRCYSLNDCIEELIETQKQTEEFSVYPSVNNRSSLHMMRRQSSLINVQNIGAVIQEWAKNTDVVRLSIEELMSEIPSLEGRTLEEFIEVSLSSENTTTDIDTLAQLLISLSNGDPKSSYWMEFTMLLFLTHRYFISVETLFFSISWCIILLLEEKIRLQTEASEDDLLLLLTAEVNADLCDRKVSNYVKALELWGQNPFFNLQEEDVMYNYFQCFAQYLLEMHGITVFYSVPADNSSDLSNAPMPRLPLTQFLDDPSSITFLDMHPTEIARQLTLLDFSYLESLKCADLFNCAWQNAEKHVLAPNTVAYTEQFNTVSYWVATEILSAWNDKQRVEIIERFISLAEELRILKNFNSLMAVVSALSLHFVSRLKQSWERVNPDLRETHAHLSALMDSLHNFKVYREHLSSLSPPFIPFQALILGDLSRAIEAMPTYLDDHPKVVNFQKMSEIGKLSRIIVLCQKTPYCLYEVPVIANYLRNLAPIRDEEALYHMSFKCQFGQRKNTIV